MCGLPVSVCDWAVTHEFSFRCAEVGVAIMRGVWEGSEIISYRRCGIRRGPSAASVVRGGELG